MIIKRWLPFLRRTHIYLGLLCAVPLLLAALSGALLAVVTPLDQELQGIPHRSNWSSTPPSSEVWMEEVRIRLRAEYGETARIVLRPPRHDDEPLLAIVKTSTWQGDLLYEMNEDRPFFKRAHDEGAWNFLFNLHSHLLLEESGRILLAVTSGGAVVLLLTGLAIRIIRSDGRPVSAGVGFHRKVGLLAGPILVFMLATGAYLAWKPISSALSTLAGQTKIPAPKLATTQDERLSVGDYLAAVERVLPGSRVGFVILPARDSLDPVLVRKHLDGETHPNGQSRVWLTQADGQILAVRPWYALDVGQRWHGWIYAFHSARLWGASHIGLAMLSGLTLAALIVQGLLLWLSARHRRRTTHRRLS